MVGRQTPRTHTSPAAQVPPSSQAKSRRLSGPGSADSVTVELQRTGELTSDGGVHDGGEESDDENFRFEHGDVGGVVAG